MAATARTRKVDRQELFDHIANLIKNSPNQQSEISSTDLAHEFQVEPPTMDHHLKALVKDGLIRATERRGRYNRKIYVLTDESSGPSIPVSVPKEEGSSEIGSAGRKWLEQRRAGTGSSVTDISSRFKTDDESATTEQDASPLTPQPAPALREEEARQPELPIDLDPVAAPAPSVGIPEFSLDQKIQDFLARSNSIPSAEVVLQKTDRDILAVVNETIQQNMIYLKDLMDQLSTVTDKNLILGLVEERNQLMGKITKLEEEVKGHVAMITNMQKQNKQEQDKIDQNRVKMMYQVMVNTIDRFVDQPNQSMALSRNEFRKQVTTELSNLVKYVLGAEK
ncbi:helix-turn-helix transcriptional regulator (plasmid) [Paenibacillus rhizovicinus]|uniref:Helix-turn-helix transcriptional regulator n=1 Tax=Paenibacillus rhizovicinus TaxID=2704463 RepID=A0A6C0PBN6_9BACL|nr:helix-turn-helix domain-containing protein [Paenibacillus rhizovicinus]QHW35775.1 helix-turn-helix transcriptional regulator [Paenibacillus rhizovicinus]